MISLFKSKLRKNILALYFSAPDKEYYIREVERLLERPAAYIRRELMYLEDAGLLISELKGKQKYFRLNQKYALYNELKEIVAKTFGIEQLLKDAISSFSEVKAAFIFGDYIKKQDGSLKEIDVLLIANSKAKGIAEKFDLLSKSSGREIKYYIYSSSEFIDKTKLKEPFIQKVLTSKKIFLTSLEEVKF